MFFFGIFIVIHTAILLKETITNLYKVLRRYLFEKKRKGFDKNEFVCKAESWDHIEREFEE